MSNPKTEGISLTEVVKYISDGDYRIPRFQRNYVWKIDKVVDLIDSLLKGFPIGAIVLWQTKNELSEVKGIGGVQIPKRDPAKYTSYIIDGQQRLTSLFFALKGLATTTVPAVDCSQICISLTASGNEKIVYPDMPSNGNPDDYVYLKNLWNATGLTGSYSDKRIHYYQLLIGYSIPSIKIADDSLGLGEVVEIFERINLGGKTLNLFSIIAASSYIPNSDTQKGFDLTASYELLSKKLKSYGSVKDTTLLQVIAACTIKKCNKSSILKELIDIDFSHLYPKIEKALLRAIDHLKGSIYGVCVKPFLPYESFLVPFAYFFYNQGNKQLTTTQQKYLADYFWRSNIANRFGSSTDTAINADLAKMDMILSGKLPAQEPISLTPHDIIQRGNTSLKSAFSKSMLCLMYANAPKSFAPGRDIFVDNNPQSDSAENQLHHFFPQRSKVVLNSQSYRDKVNCVVNIVFMDALTNQQIGNRNPSDYISEYASSNEGFSTLLGSHFIEMNEFGIETDDFDQFLKARSEKLYAALMLRIIKCKDDNIIYCEPEEDSPTLQGADICEDVVGHDSDAVVFDIFARGKYVKNHVIKYLKEKGVYLSTAITYSTFHEDRNAFWSNPNPNILKEEWTIILNNQVARSITVLVVPANTFAIRTETEPGLYVRADDPDRVDLNIRLNTLCDRKTNLDFKPYVQFVLDYSQNQ